MLQSDPFASIRRVSRERSSSFDADLPELQEHAGTRPVFQQKPQKSATGTPEHQEHRINAREAWKARAAELLAEMELPEPWAEGWAAIQLMPRPADASEARWAQIVADADRFCRGPAHSAILAGWTIPDVFGFDPDGDGGLLLAIGGGRVVILDGETASIIRPDQTRRHFSRKAGADLPPLWTIGKRTK